MTVQIFGIFEVNEFIVVFDAISAFVSVFDVSCDGFVMRLVFRARVMHGGLVFHSLQPVLESRRTKPEMTYGKERRKANVCLVVVVVVVVVVIVIVVVKFCC